MLSAKKIYLYARLFLIGQQLQLLIPLRVKTEKMTDRRHQTEGISISGLGSVGKNTTQVGDGSL